MMMAEGSRRSRATVRAVVEARDAMQTLLGPKIFESVRKAVVKYRYARLAGLCLHPHFTAFHTLTVVGLSERERSTCSENDVKRA